MKTWFNKQEKENTSALYEKQRNKRELTGNQFAHLLCAVCVSKFTHENSCVKHHHEYDKNSMKDLYGNSDLLNSSLKKAEI